ncbi:MurR/RpiR family transcriptional regulator [Alkalibacterium sp. m-11]
MNNLGLLNILGNIINEGDTNSDYAITKYILENISHLENLTVYQITEEAFVSRSSIRRFCQKIGYDNFSELKKSLTDIIYPSNIHLREFEPNLSYRSKLNDELKAMIHGLNESVSNDHVEYLAELMYKHENVIFLNANNTSPNLIKFQQELFYAGKTVRIIDNHQGLTCTNELLKDENVLLIVVSVSGVFAEAVKEMIINLKGEKILISANRSKDLAYLYNDVFYISNQDIVEDKLGLLGKYGITYLFDLISQYYIYNFHRK